MSNQPDSTSERDEVRRDYWIEVVVFILIGAAAWVVVGLMAGSGLFFEIHEWGMFWIGSSVTLLPVVVMISAILAYAAPGYAERRGMHEPYQFGRIAVLSWLFAALVITLFVFYLLYR